MNIVVTGSSGRLGSHIAAWLRRRHEVLGLDLLAGGQTDTICDLRERREVRAAVRRADAVVHTAALHVPHLAQCDAADFEAANVIATEHVLDAARSAGAQRFVFTSSTSVYGHALVCDRTVWVDEALTPIPRDAYDATKLAAEARVAAAGDRMHCTTLRVSRCFPEPLDVMAANRLFRGVDRRDVTRAVGRALGASPQRPATYVISGPIPFSRGDVAALGAAPAALIEDRCPEDARRFRGRGWSWPARIDRVYCSSLAMRELGYRPRYGLAALLDGDCDPQPLPART